MIVEAASMISWVIAFSMVQAGFAIEPPALRLIYPSPDFPFVPKSVFVKAKAEVLSGEIAEIRFFLNDMHLGTATNAPYNVVWQSKSPDFPEAEGLFYAVGRTSSGAEIRTTPFLLNFVWFHFQVPDVFVTPPDGTLIAAGTDLEITAEVVVSGTRTTSHPNTIYFNDQTYLTNVPPMRADTPPTTLVIPNVSEGEHLIGARYSEGFDCLCLPHRVRAVKLGLREPVLTWDARMEFELVTAYPGRETVIEWSGNLADWTVYQTLVPETNYVRFTVPPEDGKRWFRAVLPEGVE